MRASDQPTILRRFFSAIAGRPLIVLLCGLAAIVFFGIQAADLEKDPRAEAFHPENHPAVIDRERLIETFGLKDPIIVAIYSEKPGGVFTQETLALVHDLSQRLAEVPGIDPERITSLATEKSISGDTYGLRVETFLPAPPQTPAAVMAVRDAVQATPSMLGRLVSEDHRVTLVVGELLMGADAEAAYWNVLALVENTETAGGETLHVAGPGAMLGYLGIYMDRDARTLAPFAALLVLFSLFLAHRSAIGVIVPTLVIAGSVAVTLGTMALMGANFYVITNALPVILIGIAVDDALHIFGEYRRRVGLGSEADTKDRVVQTMLAMCRPVTVTTLTTAAGCLALGFSSSIPPMREFGLYAALGIGVAWLVSLTAVPAVMALWFGRLAPSTSSQPVRRRSAAVAEAATTGLKQLVFRRGRSVVVVSAVWLLVGLVAATSLQVDEANIDNFQEDEPIVVADALINGHGIGSNYLDIMIEGSGEDALLRPEVLQYVDALQRYAESLPLVLQSVSYLDSLGQIDKALAEPGDEPNLVLGSEDRAAQYMLLYSMSGDPADLRTLVNNSYERANLRLYLGSGWFSKERALIATLEDYLAENPAPDEVLVTLSGIAVVHVSWVGMLFEGHLGSILASLVVVWLIATISFRSPLRGSLVMVPVIFAVLTVYAAMALAGVNLGVGTSMTAAIAIGLSIDFGVHLLHRIDERCRVHQPVLQTAVGEAIQDSGRAIFFGFLTGFLGFGVLVMSEVPGVVRFGSLVALSLAASFLASLVLLPSLILTIKSLGVRLLSTTHAGHSSAPSTQRQAGNEICSSVKTSAS